MANKKLIPVIGMMLIVLGIVSSFSYSIFNNEASFAEYGGVLIDSKEELTTKNIKIQRAGGDIGAQGISPYSPITMNNQTSPLPLASMSIDRGDWYFRVEVYAKTTSPANQIYKVELWRWNSTSDYKLVGTLYIKTDKNPGRDSSNNVINEGVRCYFNLGASNPSPNESFMIVITRYQPS